MSIHKPGEMEDEFFARKEYDRLREIEQAKHKKLAEEEKANLKDLHHMKCPKCGMDLITIDYKGIQIDRCGGCAGVWLDNGELEAITDLEHGKISKLFKNAFTVKEWRSNE